MGQIKASHSSYVPITELTCWNSAFAKRRKSNIYQDFCLSSEQGPSSPLEMEINWYYEVAAI